MQAKIFTRHDSMRLDVSKEGNPKAFIRFGMNRSGVKIEIQGIDMPRAAAQMLLKAFDKFMDEKGLGNNSARFEEIKRRCEAVDTFKGVAAIFDKVTV